MVKHFGGAHRIPGSWRALALAAAVLLPALTVAIPLMDRDLAITDASWASPDAPRRYFHDHQSICVPMEASQQLASGAGAAALPELPMRAIPVRVITKVADAAPQNRLRSRSPPRT